MLEAMRKNAQSWGIKLLFGVIIVVFIFWGIGSFRANKSSVVAEVNGKTIPVQEFAQAYERTLKSLRAQNPNLTPEQLKTLKKQVLNQLINAELLRQKAKELGVVVTPQELRQAITSLPYFQNKNKQFDPNIYKNLLKINGLTPAQFEQNYKHNLLIKKMETFIGLPAQVDDGEIYDLYKFVQAKMVVDYVLLPISEYLNKVKISEQEIKEYYNKHKQEFIEPEKIKISYLLLTPKALASKEKVSAKEIEEYYKQHQQEFYHPAKVKARHILIRLPQNATQEEVKKAEAKIAKIEKALKQGKDFAELAKKYSEGPSRTSGGELGWFTRGMMVKPFEDAAFALKPGEVSKPVRTVFGLHLIKVEAKQPAGITPLAEVREEIKSKIAQSKAGDKLADLLDTVLTRIAAKEDLRTIAKELGLSLQTTDFFSAQKLPKDLQGLKPQDVKTLFSLELNATTKTPLELKDGYILATKIAQKAPALLPLAKVKERIQNILSLNKAKELAKAKAKELLTQLKAGQKIDLPIQTTKPFSRQGFIPEIGYNPKLAQAAFRAKLGMWLGTPFEVGSGYVLIKPIKVIQPDLKEFEQQKKIWAKMYKNLKERELAAAFITELRNKANIQIINPRYLN